MYAAGKGVALDYKRAVKWYTLAANQGHAKAQHNLALMYLTGKGAKQSVTKAKELLMKAAQGRKQAIEGLKQLQESRKTGRIAARKG